MVDIKKPRFQTIPPKSSGFRAWPLPGGTPRGQMAALHKFNPLRLTYIRTQAAAHSTATPKKLDCLKGLRIARYRLRRAAILSEPLARLGADGRAPIGRGEHRGDQARRGDRASASIIAPPRRRPSPKRARNSISCWRWKWSSTSSMCRPSCESCASMVKPGGLMIAATINRTLKSLALRYRRRRISVAAGCRAARISGTSSSSRRTRDLRSRMPGWTSSASARVIYNPLADRWQLSSDMDVN